MAKRKQFSALPTMVGLATLLAAVPAEALEWKQPDPEDLLEVGLISPMVVPLADGRTLVVGGLTGNLSSLSAVDQAYLIDPSASSPQKKVSKVASMSTVRHGHAAALLPGGRVLVVGGFPDAKNQAALASAEVYDPASNTWTTIESTGAARAWATATPLPDGRVLLVGGTDGKNSLDSVESFDPFAKDGAGKWNGLAPMKVGSESLGRYAHSATLLLDGRLLVAGGVRGSGATQDAVLLDLTAPTGQPWSKAANIGQGRAGHTAVRMRGGQVALLGGCSSVPSFEISEAAANGCVAENGVRFYTPEKNSWGLLGGPAPGGLGGRIWVGLRNGWILAAGGRSKNSEPGKSDGLSEKSVSFLRAPGAASGDPGDVDAPLGNSWAWGEEDASSPLTLKMPRSFAGVTVDQRGRVLVVGGLKDGFAQQSVEFLDYLDNGTPCPGGLLTPLECASGVCSDGVCCDRRCNSVCDACIKDKTNLGKDGLCGADTKEEGKLGCKLSGASCSGNSIDVGRCSGGACVTEVQDCGYFKCQDKKFCPTTCNSINDCISTNPPVVCADVGGSKVCSPQLANGAACSVDADCKSSLCEPKEPASTIKPSPARVCCAQECSNDLCDSTGVIRNFCGDGGACKKSYEYCNGFVCSNAACLTSCSTNEDCTKDHYCDAPKCKPRQVNGATCQNDAQCASGVCAEGVCCDDPECKGNLCKSCLSENTDAANGVCAPVKVGTDPRNACTDETGTNICGKTGACNGAGACAFAAAGTSCKASSCKGHKQTDYRCSGAGACEPEEKSCESQLICDVSGSQCKTGCDADTDCVGNFSCDTVGRKCRSECSQKSDCKANFNCNKATKQCVQVATCIDAVTYLDAKGIEQKCRPNHRCSDSTDSSADACAGPCRSSLDCADGFVCGASGDCRPPPVAVDPGDCFCSSPGRAASSSPAVLALLVLVLAGALQRRRAR
jgi:MYXO-CTERM domain-containing protein